MYEGLMVSSSLDRSLNACAVGPISSSEWIWLAGASDFMDNPG